MVPKEMNSALETRADETRQRIFDMTLELVETVDFEQLTVRRIAEYSGVSPALIIQYFGSKDKLFRLIFETRNHALLKTLEDQLENRPRKDIEEKLVHVSELLLKRDQETPRLTLNTMSNAFQWGREEEAEFRTRLEPFLALISKCIMKCEPKLSEDKARTATMTFFMCYSQAARIVLQHEMSREQAMTFLEPHIRLIADGIRAQAA